MANAFTDTSAMSNAVQTAYDKFFEFALRAQPLFRQVADKRPAQQTAPGGSVVLERYQDLAVATGALTENVDPDSVALGNPTTVTITLNEYGNPVLRTRKLYLFSLTDIDPAIANIVAFNAADSIDSVVQTVLRAGTNVIQRKGGTVTYVTTGTLTTPVATTMAVTDGFTSPMARLAVVKLRTNKAVPRKGSLYWCDAVDAGAGDNSVRRFRTYYAGQQALAEAVADEFHTVAGPITDKLMRFRPLGWYGVAGWARYREEALIRAESTSTIDSI